MDPLWADLPEEYDLRWGRADESASGTIENREPGKTFTTTFVHGIDSPDDIPHVEVTIAGVASATRLTLVHTFPAGATPRLRSGVTAGWSAYLGALAAATSGRPVTDADWMADVRIALVALGPP